jgi:hypothetical protein
VTSLLRFRRATEKQAVNDKLEKNIAQLEQVNTELTEISHDLSKKIREYVDDER